MTKVTPLPGLIMFESTLYWRMGGEWPSALLSREDSWPPNIWPLPANLLLMQIAVLYEAAPHDNDFLTQLGLPKVGALVSVSSLATMRIPQLLYDLASSAVEAIGLSPPLISFPSWVDAMLPSFSLKAEFSCMCRPRS